MSSAMPPPTYLANENRGKGFIIFAIILGAVATLCVIGRFISRAMSGPGSKLNPRFWWDDWAALISLCLYWPNVAIAVRMYHLGLGRHLWTIPEDNVKSILKYVFIVYFPYDAGLVFAKASALLFYSRVFMVRLNKWLRWTIYTIHAANILWLVALYIANFLQCNPPAKNWNPFLPGKCSPTSDLWLGSAVPSVVIDLAILLLPLPVIWGLSLNGAKKFGLIIVFLLGYCTIVVSIGRVVYSIKLGAKLDEDLTYAGIPVFYWLAAEVPVSIISICLPAMLNLGRRIAANFSPLHSFLSSYFSSRSGSTMFSSRKSSSKSTLVQSQDEKEKEYSQWGYAPNLDPKGGNTYTVSVSRNHLKSENATRQSTDQGSESGADSSLPPDGIHMQSEFSVVSIDGDERV